MRLAKIDRFIIYGFPSCPYCLSATKLLEESEHQYFFISLGKKSRALKEVKQAHGQETVPIVLAKYKDGDYKLVGGCSDLKDWLNLK